MTKILFGYTPSYILLRPWKLFEEIYSELRFAWQRVFRGWDDRVIWSLDYYLIENMPVWLTKLKKNKRGVPFSLFTEEELSDPNGISEEAEERARNDWDFILDLMINGFDAAKWIIDHAFDKDFTEEMAYDDFNRGMDLFKEYFFSLWD